MALRDTVATDKLGGPDPPAASKGLRSKCALTLRPTRASLNNMATPPPSLSHTRTHTHTHTFSLSLTHTVSLSLSLSLTHTRTLTHSLSGTHTHARTHARARARTHAHHARTTRVHTHPHPHPHTHTPTHPPTHVMSCHGALEPSSAGPPSGRPSAERLAVTHTRTPMEWAPGEGGPRAPCMARRREAPGPSKVHHGQASGRSETPVPPTGPGFLGTGGSHL